MSNHSYFGILNKKEDRIAKEMFRNFADKEIMPVRQQIDED